ncbi:class I SAM-dependent methyltransferase [Mycolicibacterium palauense]|uniref:class I SAM-dependent methyltransferase n=1 Tax=Mycolicibacterium palauense TaxID=2034511 RepID=UPI000BFEF7C3|nr:class I SAM-dependent methyltransferase [Mycolicibacterium palauense]
MAYMESETERNPAIDRMPRGGFDASCLDRMLQTDRREYLDRDDIDESVKRQVIDALDWTGRVFGNHQRFARIALEEIAEVPDPRILELGAGHGALSEILIENHPTAQVTATDVDPAWVAALAAGELGSHPRVTVRQMDATAIDAPDGSFDLVVFALSFHHLRPSAAARVLAEGTRVGARLLIIDLPRLPAPLHALQLASMLPLSFIPLVHDGVISSLRTYSRSALRSLALHADPTIELELRGGWWSPQIVVARRAAAP